MFDSPPETIPDNLTAQEYLDLGKWYKEKRNYSRAREALQRAVDGDRGSPIAVEARRYIAQNIPAADVPAQIIERFDKIVLSTILNPRKTIDECRTLTLECPDFDWAHHALANALTRTGKVQNAIVSLEQALAINPDRIETLLSMAEAQMIVMDYTTAQKYLQKIAALLVPTSAVTAAEEQPRHRVRFEEFTRSLQILVDIG